MDENSINIDDDLKQVYNELAEVIVVLPEDRQSFRRRLDRCLRREDCLERAPILRADLDLLSHLNNLAIDLALEARESGAHKFLDWGIICLSIACNAAPDNYVNKPALLSTLSQLWRNRSDTSGSSLDRALILAKMALDPQLTRESDPHRHGRLNNLATCLEMRYKLRGSLDDLEESVQAIETALASIDDHEEYRPDWLSNLGNNLGRRSMRNGSLDDLNKAVELLGEAVLVTSAAKIRKARCLNNYSFWLSERFNRNGSTHDLTVALSAATEAVKAIPSSHVARPTYLTNLIKCLTLLGHRKMTSEFVDEAVEAAREGVLLTSETHSELPARLSNYGICLSARFDAKGTSKDLEMAISVYRKAVGLLSQQKSDKLSQSSVSHNLAKALLQRYKHENDRQALQEAIDVAETIDMSDPPEEAKVYILLGYLYNTRHKRDRASGDSRLSLAAYMKAWAIKSAAPSTRITAARLAAAALAAESRWEDARPILKDAIVLLPLVSTRHLADDDKQHLLRSYHGLASLAAAVSLQAGTNGFEALSVLEQGRCVISGNLLDMRTDLSSLSERCPQLAAEFSDLRDQLDQPTHASIVVEQSDEARRTSKTEARIVSERNMKQLLLRIRDIPGFDNFLMPPREDELISAAVKGPVVIINVSPYRCDAFLVQLSGITVLSLGDLSESKLYEILQENSVETKSTLEWLWKVAMRPILDALGANYVTLDNEVPHIWWLPTGVLTNFPIHAAGLYHKG